MKQNNDLIVSCLYLLDLLLYNSLVLKKSITNKYMGIFNYKT